MNFHPAKLDSAAPQRLADALAADEVVHPLGVAVGQTVLIVEGGLASFPADVEEILPSAQPENPEAAKLKVGVSLFG